MFLPATTKQEIRQYFRNWRHNISPQYLDTASNSCCASLSYLLPLLPGNIVALYSPIGNEINLLPLIPELEAKGYTITLPAFTDNQAAPLSFKEYHPNQLKLSKFGFLEPDNNLIFKPDIIIVPALAIDLQGNRIGYGKGHYDKVLHHFRNINHSFTSITCIFPEQLISSIPYESHDQLIDTIIS